jgi:hypothetical protein
MDDGRELAELENAKALDGTLPKFTYEILPGLIVIQIAAPEEIT